MQPYADFFGYFRGFIEYQHGGHQKGLSKKEAFKETCRDFITEMLDSLPETPAVGEVQLWPPEASYTFMGKEIQVSALDKGTAVTRTLTLIQDKYDEVVAGTTEKEKKEDADLKLRIKLELEKRKDDAGLVIGNPIPKPLHQGEYLANEKMFPLEEYNEKCGVLGMFNVEQVGNGACVGLSPLSSDPLLSLPLFLH